LGAIKVLDGTDTVIKFVAIFGGGRDPDNLTTGGSGGWLYMVDIETGQILYKEELEGSAPAEPSAVDTNQDGYLDRIYIGTTAGYLYRANIGIPQPLVMVNGQPRVTASSWRPRKIFDTVTTDASGLLTRRPIYFPPSVIFVARLGTYALSFGTGNREDLWSSEVDNRFYVFIDDSDNLDPVTELPMTEANFTALGSGNTTADYLQEGSLTGGRGWFLKLDAALDERVVTPSDAIAGIIVFSTFIPEIDDTTADPDNSSLKLCEKSGDSRNYVVFATNGNGAYTDDLGNPSRFETVANSFVTEPYVEQGQTRNYSSEAEDPLDPRLRSVMESIKELLPKDCRFNDSYRFDIKTVRSDTGVVKIAPLPVCIRETNWKQF
jgi:type IV pilus assembly protein PilY1